MKLKIRWIGDVDATTFINIKSTELDCNYTILRIYFIDESCISIPLYNVKWYKVVSSDE